jgi:hypothetical protein
MSTHTAPHDEIDISTVEARMHPSVFRLAALCWACFMAVFWVTFWVSSDALFQVVIGTVYAVMVIGVPYEMSKFIPENRKADKSIWQFMAEPFRTNSGVLPGYEAAFQVIMVPVLLIIGGTAMGIIIRMARPG